VNYSETQQLLNGVKRAAKLTDRLPNRLVCENHKYRC